MNVHSLAAYLRENRTLLRRNGDSLLDQALDYGKEKALETGRGIAEDAAVSVTDYAREQGGDLVGAAVGAGTNYLMDEYVREDKPMDTATFAALLAKQRLPQTAFRGDSLSNMIRRGFSRKQAPTLTSKNTQPKFQAAQAVLEAQKQEAAEQEAKAASKKKYWIAGGVVAAALITTGIVIAVNSKSES